MSFFLARLVKVIGAGSPASLLLLLVPGEQQVQERPCGLAIGPEYACDIQIERATSLPALQVVPVIWDFARSRETLGWFRGNL